jgi:hypothetical protein
MTAKLSLLNRQLVVESTGTDVKSIFRELAQMAEVFGADSVCGACNSPDIRLAYRAPTGYEYFTLRCNSCDAELNFSQRKDGTGLFPRRKDEEGRMLADKGWKRFTGRAIEAKSNAY